MFFFFVRKDGILSCVVLLYMNCIATWIDQRTKTCYILEVLYCALDPLIVTEKITHCPVKRFFSTCNGRLPQLLFTVKKTNYKLTTIFKPTVFNIQKKITCGMSLTNCQLNSNTHTLDKSCNSNLMPNNCNMCLLYRMYQHYEQLWFSMIVKPVCL